MVRGELSEHFASGFEGIDLEIKEGQTTLLAGEILNQAHLHELLNCLSNLGLELLNFKAISEREEG